MRKIRTTGDKLVGKRVIFRHTNDKGIDRFCEDFYGTLYDISFDPYSKSYYATKINQTQIEFFLTDGWEMNAHVYSPKEDPEYFL
jgi:hypothetical protein